MIDKTNDNADRQDKFFLQAEQFLLARPRLFQSLALGLAGKPLTLVVAPAGYGKTATVTTWLNQLKVNYSPWSTVWLTLDEQDNDLNVFLQHLIEAVRQVSPQALQGMEAAINELPALSPEQLGGELIRGLQNLRNPLLVVLDGYHFLNSKQIHTVLRSLFRYQPHLLHTVITARHEPDLDLTALLGHSQVNRLQADDFIFTDREAQVLLAGISRKPIDDETTSSINQAVGGRALELRMVGYLLGEGHRPEQIIDVTKGNSRRATIMTLQRMGLETLPPEDRELFVRLIPLKVVNSELATITLRHDGHKDIDYHAFLYNLTRRFIFLYPVDNRPGWYQIYSHWEDVTAKDVNLPIAPEIMIVDRFHASSWLRSHDYVDSALNLMAGISDSEAMAGVVESVLPNRMAADDWHTVRRLVARLPAEEVARRPRLLMAQAWGAWLSHDQEGLPGLIEQARHALLHASIPPEETRLMEAEMDILLGSPSYTESPPEERLGRLLQLFASLDNHSPRARAEALVSLRYVRFSPEEGEALAARLIQEINSIENPGVSTRLVIELGRLYIRMGPVYKLEELCRNTIANFAEQLEPVHRSVVRNGLGIAAYCRDDPMEAVAQFEAALEGPHIAGMEVISGMAEYIMPVYGQLGLTDRIDPLMRSLRRLVSEEDQLSSQNEWSAVEAYAALHTGNLAAATRWANTLDPNTPLKPDSGKVHVFVDIALAAASPEMYEAALSMVNRLIDITHRACYVKNLNWVQALRARLLWVMGDHNAAAHQMASSIREGYYLGFRRWYLEGGPEIKAMLTILEKRGPVQEEAADLLKLLARRQTLTIQAPRSASPVIDLTPRESELLLLLAKHMHYKEIAQQLHLSPNTVRNLATRLYAKLDVPGRSAAVRRARELGLLPTNL